MRCMPWSRLICDEKGLFLPAVAMADDHLYDDDSIEAPAKHSMDRIRNAGVGRMGHKLAG